MTPWTGEDLIAAYRAWAGDPAAAFPAPTPIGNVDVFEDGATVVNRVFFLISDVSSGGFRCFFFCAENRFRKDAAGDLTLCTSAFYPLAPYASGAHG